MGRHRLSIPFIAGYLFFGAALLPADCSAHRNSAGEPSQAQADPDACADLKVFPKLPMSVIVSCDKGDPIELILPLKPDAQGYSREKKARGTYEFREYRLPTYYQQEQAFQQLMQLLPIAGFTSKYSETPSTISARKGDIWLLITVGGEYYDVKSVIEPEALWTPARDAQEISREMEAHNRVAIYGIEFSSDNQTVVEERSKILTEICKYLKANSGLTIEVQSHTMSKNGNAEEDTETTRKRAQAVATWLIASGIASARLRPQAMGRNKPISENDTPLEIQRNDRIELVKTAP